MKKIPLSVMMFALVWALALLLPSVRELWRALPIVLSSGGTTLWGQERAPWFAPNDPLNLEAGLEEKFLSTPEKERSNVLHEMDALAAQHPDQKWIVAQRLLLSVHRVPDFDPITGKQLPSGKVFLSASELDLAARIAAQASASEPDNAFWPWMEAIFRMVAGQQEASVAAIERAAKAKHFNDYIQSTVHARLVLRERFEDVPWEHRISSAFSILLPHLTPMRGVTYALANEALRARKQGDNARALRIGAAILRANEVLRRNSDTIIGSLIAEANGYNLLETVLEIPKLSGRKASDPTQPDALAEHRQLLVQKWALYARAHGRNDLASSANWLAQPSVSQKVSAYYGQELWAQLGLPSSQARFAMSAPILLFALGALCALWALTWTISALLSLRRSSLALPSRGRVAACANFAFWALAGALAVGVKTGWLFDAVEPFVFLFSDTQDKGVPVLLLAAFALSCWLAPVGFWAWKRDRRFRLVRLERGGRRLARWFGRARLLAWVGFGSLAFLVVSTGRLFEWTDAPWMVPLLLVLAMAAFGAVLSLEIVRLRSAGRTWPRLRLEGEVPRSAAPRALRWARFGAWTVAFLCAVLVLLAQKSFSDVPTFIEYPVLVLGLIAGAVGVFLNGRIGRGDGFGFALLARSAGVLSLVWSVVFLVAALAAWPLRAELNHQLDRRLAMREEDWMKEQLRKYPPDAPHS